jgi:hypothetical protein
LPEADVVAAEGDKQAQVPAPKTAVVVIHGMGEQRPMETLRGLVQALWTCDSDITGPHDRTIYSKPDAITGSFELRRITTRNVKLENDYQKRVDFFEFYWAHLMTGNTIKGVASWLAGTPARLLGGFVVSRVCFLQERRDESRRKSNRVSVESAGNFAIRLGGFEGQALR